MTSIKREELIGNILKSVKIRFDYSNIFGISPETLREIADILFKSKFDKTRYSKIKEEDFLNLDSVLAENSVPLEYLRGLDSYSFMSNDSGIIININQLFCEITLNANITRYNNFEELYAEIEPVINILKEKLKINIIRAGVTKIDEVYFENFDSFLEYFNENIMEFCIWNNEYIAESKVKQNFQIDNMNINIVRLLDKGFLNSKEMFRLCFVYDVYSTDDKWINENIKQSIYDINFETFELFKKSITENTINCLKNGDKIGDDFNE